LPLQSSAMAMEEFPIELGLVVCAMVLLHHFML
jgi:hypothetical protein